MRGRNTRIEIYRRENWHNWECLDFRYADFRGLDPEKDRWMLAFALANAGARVRDTVMKKLGIAELPELPENVDDAGDAEYAPYLLLREQVKRESDYWALKEAVFEAPDERMRRFAFCRLTGFSWPSDECDAYSYRTYSCGLKSGVSREDIEDLCREVIDRKGEFAREAARWLRELANIDDDTLADWSSGRTERQWDDDPEERLIKWMRPAPGCAGADDLEDKVRGIFDACILNRYEARYVRGAGAIRLESMDRFGQWMSNWLRGRSDLPEDCVGVIAEVLNRGGRQTPALTPEAIRDIAWSASPRSPRHSYFLWMAHWFGLETEEDDAQALKLLADAAEGGHLPAFDQLVRIYDSGKTVRRNVKLALQWQEKKVALCAQRVREGADGTMARDAALEDYAGALREMGDLLMKEGYARRAKQYSRQADQLTGGNRAQ